MKMKKVFLFALATAVMSFAGCQEKEQEAPVNPNEGGSTFEFVADIAQTKTTLDVANGYKVDWEESDVVYMVTDDGTWGKPYNDDKTAATIAEFKYADGKFTSEATIADGEYTFKGMYASASQKSYHRGASSTHKLEATQTQDCANPTAHIKANDALVGTFTATVPMTEMAKMNMSHLYTLMQVNIKNATGAAVEIAKFEMTAAGANLAGVFNVTAFDTPAITKKQNESSTITVNLTGGSVENNASLPVYFVMAPLSNYAGDVTFKVTDSEGKTYTKTVTMNGISFEAGKYNTTPYTIKEADVVEPEPEGTVSATISFASDAQRISQDGESQVWENDEIIFTNAQHNSTNAVVSNVNPVRLYKNSKITIEAPGNIIKIEFNSATGDYLSALKSLLPNASVSSSIVTEVYDGSSNAVEYVLSTGQLRFNSITVTYSTEGYVPPVLESIEVSGDYKTEFTQGSTFSFGGVVTATYDNGATKMIAEGDCEFTGYNLNVLGDQTVTVTYEGITCEYDITVVEKPAAGTSVTVEMTSFSAVNGKIDDVVSYTTARGGGTSNPAVNNNEIRLYQNSAGTGGGTITIKAADGYVLTSVTIGSSMKTSVAYTIDDSTTKSTSTSIAANGKYTVSDIDANSITFYCMGTDKNSRLYVNYLSATYEN